MKIKKKLPLAVIIDDDEFYVMILKKLMSICQFADTVLTFQNGKEAYDYLWMVKELPHQWPDVILLDINMPVMNGFQERENIIYLKAKKPGTTQTPSFLFMRNISALHQ